MKNKMNFRSIDIHIDPKVVKQAGFWRVFWGADVFKPLKIKGLKKKFRRSGFAALRCKGSY